MALQVLFFVLIAVAFVGHLWVLLLAWRVSALWFLVCLLFAPVGSVVFAVIHTEALKPMLMSAAPVLVAFFAAIFVPNYVRYQERARQHAVERGEQAPSSDEEPVTTDAPGAEPERAAAPPDKNEPPPAIAATKCTVDSTPPGAEVLVDGTLSGHTPAVVTLWAGRDNVLTVRRPGFFPVVETIFPNLNQNTERHVTLRSGTPLKVTSTPADAEVLVAGRQVLAKTPGQVDAIDLGEQEIVIRKAGHVDAVRVVDAKGNEPVELDVVLSPAAYVNVRSFPSPAKIFVDGQPTARETPAEVPVSADEKHVIEVRRALHLPAKQKVMPMVEGDREDITIAMEVATEAALKEGVAARKAELKKQETALKRLVLKLERALKAGKPDPAPLQAARVELERLIKVLSTDVQAWEGELALSRKAR